MPENESPGEPRSYPDLPPGRYRLVKEVCGWPLGCRNASVEFEVGVEWKAELSPVTGDPDESAD